MVVFNSGTLSLWGLWVPTTLNPPFLLPLQTPVPKRKNLFLFFWKDFNIDAFTSTLQPYLFQLYFSLFVIILWVFISFFALLLLYYYFYGCLKCIYVSWPWVTPLLSWARSTLKGVVWKFGLGQTKREQKHWVTKCHLEVFLNVVFMIHFHIAAIVICFFVAIVLFSDVTHDQLLSVNAKLCRKSLNTTQKSFPMLPWGCR